MPAVSKHKTGIRQILIRFPKDLADALKEDAKHSYRSVNKHVAYLVRKHLETAKEDRR
jgi:hypothetical protein